MTGTLESPTPSAQPPGTKPHPRPPTQPAHTSPDPAGFPYSPCPDPTLGLLHSVLLHSTPDLRGAGTSPLYLSRRKSFLLGQGASKGLEVQWGWPKVWEYKCGIYPGGRLPLMEACLPNSFYVLSFHASASTPSACA